MTRTMSLPYRFHRSLSFSGAKTMQRHSFPRLCVCFSLIAMLCFCTNAQVYAAKKHHKKDDESTEAKAGGEKNHSKKEGESAKPKASVEKGHDKKETVSTKPKAATTEPISKTAVNGKTTSSEQANKSAPGHHPEYNPRFQENHPRQTEVLKRTDHEHEKIEEAYDDGKITKSQRDLLESERKNVRKEDFTDAKANGKIPGGYITKGQKRVMNKQEDNINKELKEDEGGGVKPIAKPVEK